MEPSEHEAFLKHLRTELPSSFRLNMSSPFRHTVAQQVEVLCSQLTGLSYVSTPEPTATPVAVEPPRPLTWYKSTEFASDKGGILKLKMLMVLKGLVPGHLKSRRDS